MKAQARRPLYVWYVVRRCKVSQNFPGIYSNDEVDGSNQEDILVDQDNGISAGTFVRNRDKSF